MTFLRSPRAVMMGCAILCAFGLAVLPPDAAAQSTGAAPAAQLPPDVNPE